MSNTGFFSDTGVQKTNLNEFSVTEISSALKKTVEERFGHVRIRGEVSGYRGPHSSGHCYFSMKDDRARIEAVIWKGVFSRLKHLPQEGLEIVATGKLTTYPGSSKYQIVIEHLEPAGVGALMALLEERKKKLEAEGLFAPERKQLLPYMPRRIGVITSPTGAVIRDILHRISDRFPLQVIVWPVRVQGETTGAEVSNAINGFNAMPEAERPDIVIVARGGGSIEDLWGFNDEAAVRAAADSHIPLISAVGHETDWTLIDYAADVRAPTPTGAAEIAVPVKAELEATIAAYRARLQSALTGKLDRSRTAFVAATRGLATPDALLAMPRRRLDEASGRLGRGLDLAARAKRTHYERVGARLSSKSLGDLIRHGSERTENAARRNLVSFRNKVTQARSELTQLERRLPIAFQRGWSGQASSDLAQLERRLPIAFERRLEDAQKRFGQANRMLESMSYKSVLSRGYAVIRDDENRLVSAATDLQKATRFEVEFKDGRVDAVVSGAGAEGADGSSVAKRPVSATSSDIAKSRKSAKTTKGSKNANEGSQGSLF